MVNQSLSRPSRVCAARSLACFSFLKKPRFHRRASPVPVFPRNPRSRGRLLACSMVKL